MAHDSDIDTLDLRQSDKLYWNSAKVIAIRERDSSGRKHNYPQLKNNLSNERRSSLMRNVGSPERKYEFSRRRLVESSYSGGDSKELDFSSLLINEAPKTGSAGVAERGSGTYRCRLPLVSPLTPSSLSSRAKHPVRVLSCTIDKTTEASNIHNETQVQRYAVNGTKVVEFSGSSVNLSEGGNSTNRSTKEKRAYEEWLEKKNEEDRRRKEELELEKRAEQERIAKEREERERLEHENLLRWKEKKRKEEANKRQMLERELEIERKLKQVENEAMIAKTLHLRMWARKKKEQEKALQRQEEMKKKMNGEERKKRLAESEKAYTKWRENSKNRPKPATQGLLPHQMAKPSYVNPNPWVMDDVETEDTLKPSSADLKKIVKIQAESNAKKSIISK